MVEPALGLLPQFSRYTLVSALALVLDFTVYLLFAAGGTTGALAGAIGYACGLALHYLLSVPSGAKAEIRLRLNLAMRNGINQREFFGLRAQVNRLQMRVRMENRDFDNRRY